ncbi:MAG: hypothetical protein WCK98_07645 [bacterium]
MHYDNIREEELKIRVGDDYFSNFDKAKIIGNVDFCVSVKRLNQSQLLIEDTESQSFLWAEAKKGQSNVYHSLVQLILTIGKARTFDKELPPFYLGAFDSCQIAFVPYSKIQEIFYKNDFNWTVTPSNYETKEFKQIYEMVREILEKDYLIFDFEKEQRELKDFIKSNFVLGLKQTNQIQVDKNNFISIYNKWLQKVKPSLIVDWDLAKKANIIDGDFYLADLLSKENQSLSEKLYVLLKGDYYELDKKIDESGFWSTKKTNFNDNQKAHTQFWNRYKRPPKKQYWDYLVERRDLLVPQDVRERKGSFFTPQIWVEKSQEYLTDVLGENWQDEYYIWDCAAGTGNLLAGLTNKYNIYASTLDKQDVDVMHQRIETMNQNSVSGHGANLLQDHIFQFDFLNDDFNDPKVPKSLQEILKDPEKRKKLVMYINPPYAETMSHGEKSKEGLNDTKVNQNYKDKLTTASNRELFVQFLTRIYFEISGCFIGEFSTIKILQSPNFKSVRQFFLAKLEKAFLVPADTFDNVKGQFPIGFKVWNTDFKERFIESKAEIYDKNGQFLGVKALVTFDNSKSINEWLISTRNRNNSNNIAFIACLGNDFQQNNVVHIMNDKKQMPSPRGNWVTNQNLIEVGVYYAVRKVLPATWLNDRDQFLYPNDSWKTDVEFQNDCLAFVLFHGQNRISSKAGINHWIPFTEDEVGARERFDSHFMTDFVGGKLVAEPLRFQDHKARNDGIQWNGKHSATDELFENQQNFILTSPLQFSPEATAVFDAGRELWGYYHRNVGAGFIRPTNSTGSINASPTYNPNASLYDIREYFQGRNEAGKMNNKSEDVEYTLLIANLRESLKVLATKIQPKVYEYGFLRG